MTKEEAIKRLKEIDIRDALQEDYDALYMAIKALEQEPKTGRGKWIEERTYMECPHCHDIWHYEENQTERFKYCPNCGADMRGEE